MEHRGRGRAHTAVRRRAGGSLETRGGDLHPVPGSAPRIYRRFYELVGDYATIQVPTELLTGVAPPTTEIVLRRAGAADFEAIDAIYATWWRRRTGR